MHVAIILACGTAFRLIYQMAYKPFWSGDSHGYSLVFYDWTIRHTYSIAERPPVYSLSLGLVQWLAGKAPVEYGMGVTSQYLVIRLQSGLDPLAETTS